MASDQPQGAVGPLAQTTSMHSLARMVSSPGRHLMAALIPGRVMDLQVTAGVAGPFSAALHRPHPESGPGQTPHPGPS